MSVVSFYMLLLLGLCGGMENATGIAARHLGLRMCNTNGNRRTSPWFANVQYKRKPPHVTLVCNCAIQTETAARHLGLQMCNTNGNRRTSPWFAIV
ncbi:MAG: hypothetical protein IJF67_03335, partial [Clostridia bacterium]|nr:hypothetical protein [Clostridia bacterium]